MKKLLILVLIVLIAAAAVAWHKRDSVVGLLSMSKKRVASNDANVLGTTAKNGKKILVAYFSWGGNTRAVARAIHELAGGDLFEIRPEKPYPDEYKSAVEAVKAEREAGVRPAIAGPLPDTSGYDIVLLGYPIWWYREPEIIDAFVAASALDGVTILPFATSGSSTVDESVKHLKEMVPNAKFGSGLLANISSKVEPWLKAEGAL